MLEDLESNPLQNMRASGKKKPKMSRGHKLTNYSSYDTAFTKPAPVSSAPMGDNDVDTYVPEPEPMYDDEPLPVMEEKMEEKEPEAQETTPEPTEASTEMSQPPKLSIREKLFQKAKASNSKT